MVQLAITAGIIAIFFAESVREYAVKNQWIFWVAFAGTFACIITLACCENMRRKTPHNFIFLGVFTCCEGVLLGCACASFKASEVGHGRAAGGDGVESLGRYRGVAERLGRDPMPMATQRGEGSLSEIMRGLRRW